LFQHFQSVAAAVIKSIVFRPLSFGACHEKSPPCDCPSMGVAALWNVFLLFPVTAVEVKSMLQSAVAQ